VLHVTGHVHESHGRYEISRTASINASVHGHANQSLDRCWVAEIEEESSTVSFNQLPIGGWTCGSGVL
jgi:Icc-related predicted phosphoesterase